jgi:hypothetical protein
LVLLLIYGSLWFNLLFHFCEDVAGLVMRTSSERECIRDGKTTKEVVLHIFDNRLAICTSFKIQLYWGTFSVFPTHFVFIN